jgi:catechol 2,3-dioxygenase-like lactoylglutathione lyase family enzyme
MAAMDVLMSRVLLQPVDPGRSRRFYREVLGLPVYREFGDPDEPGLVFFLGGGFLELSGRAAPGGSAGQPPIRLWLQVRDVAAEYGRLRAAGVAIDDPPRTQPWGLIEMWLADPDGHPIVLVEVPADHPLRRDQR